MEQPIYIGTIYICALFLSYGPDGDDDMAKNFDCLLIPSVSAKKDADSTKAVSLGYSEFCGNDKLLEDFGDVVVGTLCCKLTSELTILLL